jgi:putative ABC transport system permease protein
MPSRSWQELIASHARDARIDLAPATVDELAAHLEDAYLAARNRGASEEAAHEHALQLLKQSGLSPLKREPRPDPRAAYAHAANTLSTAAVSKSGFRSLAMMYALRMALRQFRLHPTFALITVLVLGLGTGAATVVYTIVDTVVLRPLPYRAPDALVKFWDTNPEKGLTHDPISPVTFMDYRALPVFEDAAGWWRPEVNLVDPGLDPVRVKTIEVSANLFSVLGVETQVGPGFPAGGPIFDRNLIAVISDRLWRTRYNGDTSIVGKQISLNNSAYTVAGVMKTGFHFPDDVDVWQRLRWDFTQHSRSAHFVEAVARLAPGTSLEQARAGAATLAAKLATEYPASNKGWAFGIVPLLEDQLGYYRPALYVLFGAVGLLFVIGCLNVASLLLTRALGREREIAVRTALGAAPRQIVTQLLAESFLLSLAGAAAGLLVAVVALPIIAATMPVEVPRLADASVNGRVLTVALGLVAGMTMVFGLVPALILVRRSLGADLRSGERGSSRTARGIYQGLVISEVALACALLVGSVLLIRTVGEMTAVRLGVTGENVVVSPVQLSVNPGQLESWITVGQKHTEILDRIRESPGVTAAGATNFLPLEHGWRGPFQRADAPPVPPEERPQAQHHVASEGYFEAMGAKIVNGRAFAASDIASTEGVVIVNEEFVRRFYADRSPLGEEMLTWTAQVGPLGRNLKWTFNPDGSRVQPRLRIVGVVANIQNVALGLPVEPALYYPTRQFPFSAVTLAIAARDTATAEAALRSALKSVSPSTPVGKLETWSQRFRSRTAEPRLLMTTLTVFGALAAFLAALGVYGLFSWSVALRQRELAIRLTLGAKPSRVAGAVVRHCAVLAAVGLIGGLAFVRLAHGALTTVLFGVKPGDVTSTAVAALLLLTAALLASLLPAWRATKVNPVEGLRAE